MKRAYRNPSYIFFSWLKNYFHVKKWGVIGLLLTAILTSPGAGLARAGDLEVFLGTSSGFKIVRGTSVSSGTTTFYVGSSTVSIGTTTQAAMLTIDGSMTASSISTGTITATTGTLTIRGTGLNNYGTVATGGLIVGTVSANSAVTGGTTTVHFLDDIFAHGTVTATGFIGDGSRLTNVPAGSPGANSVDSSQLVNTLNITDTTMNVGSLTVSAGNFRVDSAGSTTVSVLTTTGSATVSGTVTAAGGNFTVNGNTGAVTASNSFTLSSGTLTAGGGAFRVDEAGSTTVKTLTVSPGTLTAGRGAFKVDENGSMTASSISTGTITATTGTLTIRGTGLNNYGTVATGGLIVGTVSANSAVTGGTTTVHFLDDIYAHGTVTAAGFIGDGSRLTNVPAGSPSANSVDSSQLVNTLNITDTTMNVGSLTVSAGNFRVDSAGSTTVSVLTTTGSATVAGTMTAAGGNFTVNGSTGAVTANNSFTLSTGTLTAGGGAFKVDEVGSTTVKTLTVSPGTLTAGRGAFKVDENGSMTATTITATGSVTASNGLTVKNGASAGYMDIYEPSGSGTNKINIQSQGISADYTLTLPVDDGASGQSLTTDGSGALSWTTVSGGSSVYGFVQLTSTTGTGFSAETNFGANETESTATSGTTWDAANSKLTINAGNGGTYKVFANLVLIGSDNSDTYDLALKVESTTKNSVTGFVAGWNTYTHTWSIAWVGTINASESVSITIVRASGTGNMKYGSGATLYVEKL